MSKNNHDCRTYIPSSDHCHMPLPIERRKQTDLLANTITTLSIISWSLAIFSLVFVGFAQQSGDILVMWGIRSTAKVNMPIIYLAFYLLASAGILCIAGMICNMFRLKRKSDRFRKSFIIVGALSIIGSVTIVLVFF